MFIMDFTLCVISTRSGGSVVDKVVRPRVCSADSPVSLCPLSKKRVPRSKPGQNTAKKEITHPRVSGWHRSDKVLPNARSEYGTHRNFYFLYKERYFPKWPENNFSVLTWIQNPEPFGITWSEVLAVSDPGKFKRRNIRLVNTNSCRNLFNVVARCVRRYDWLFLLS